MAVGVPVGGRTEAPPEPDDAIRARFAEQARALAPEYRTELLGP